MQTDAIILGVCFFVIVAGWLYVAAWGFKGKN